MGLFRSLLPRRWHPADPRVPEPWLVALAEGLGGTTRPALHPNESGLVEGTSPDGLPWSLRILSRKEADPEAPSEVHHVLWSSDALEREDVLMVFGSSDRDAPLWIGLDGVTVHADQMNDRLDEAFRDLGNLVTRVGDGSLSGTGFLSRFRALDDGGPMPGFVARALPFALPHPFSAPWHALTVDPVAAARLLTPAAMARLEQWRAAASHHESWLRAWVGGRNLRLEAFIVDPEIHAHRALLELGLALTRSAVVQYPVSGASSHAAGVEHP